MDLAQEPALKLGGLDIRPSIREIVFAGGRDVLEPRVMMVLVTLVRAGGDVVSRDQLIEACWDGRIVSDDAINRVISRIRRVGELTAGRDFTLETITKVGYRLVATTQDAAPASPSSVAPAEPPTAQPASGPAADRPPPDVIRRQGLGLAAAGLVVLLALLVGGWFIFRPAPGTAATRTLTLAVLPFDSLSPGSDNATLALGMSREIRNTLSRVRGLRVVSDASSFAVAAEHLSATAMRERLGADLLLDGSCIRDGENVKLTAELVDAWSGVNLWTGAQEGPVSDLDRLRTLMSSAIFEQLAARIGPKRLAMSSPPRAEDPRVFRLTLESNELMRQAQALARHGDYEAAMNNGDKAAALIEQALKIDPAAPSALAMKADIVTNAMTHELWNNGLPTVERFSEAAGYLRRAVATDPDNTLALLRLAENYRRNEWRWTEARELFERALALDPNDFDIHVFYSFYLSGAGRCAEALDQARQSLRLDPENRERNVLIPRMLKCLGRIKESDDAYMLLLDHDPGNLFLLTEIYIDLLSRNDAPALRKLIAHMHDDDWKGAPPAPVQTVLDRMALAADALEGRPAAFQAFLEKDMAGFEKRQAEARVSDRGRRSADIMWTYALEYAWAGEPKQAVEMLSRAIAGGSLYIPETMPYGYTEFTPAVRADHRYQTLWNSDPRLVELKRLRLKALEDRQMMGVLPDGRVVKPD